MKKLSRFQRIRLKLRLKTVLYFLLEVLAVSIMCLTAYVLFCLVVLSNQ